MSNVVLAANGAGSQAVDAIVQHHAELTAALAARVTSLLDAAADRRADAAATARSELVHWCRVELLPNTTAEEEVFYPVASQLPEARAVVTGLVRDHRELAVLVDRVELASDAVRAAAAASALGSVLTTHIGKEDDLLLPLVAASPSIALDVVLERMRSVLDQAREERTGELPRIEAAPAGDHGGACGCGEVDATDLPELDARTVPHAIRHATIFGALDAVAPGGGMVLVAPHDPLPLLAQIEQRASGTFDVEYLERGPDAWRLRFTHRGR